MEINFKKAELTDKPLIDAVIRASSKRFCELTFGNLFCWADAYGTQVWCDGETFTGGSPDKKRFFVPIGRMREQVIERILEKYGACRFSSLDESDIPLFDERFEIVKLEDYCDYIYTSESLQELRGKKLAAKRNHINAFLADGEWYTERITEDCIDELIAFNSAWCKGRCNDDPSLRKEMCATKTGLLNFKALGYEGLKLYKNGTLVAYSFGEPINADTYCVHVEKADDSVRGAYQMINREFARQLCADYEYINREDDAGDEGLRRAKQSYGPTELGQKYMAIYRG